MKLRKMRYLILSLGMVLLFVSACGSVTGTPGSSQTAIQVLQKSANAMKGLKTVHFDMNLGETLNMGSSTSSSSSPTTSNHYAITVKANGDELVPNQVSLQTTTATSTGASPNLKFAETVTGGKVYIQNSKGQWFVLSESQFKSGGTNPFAGTDISGYNNLLTLAQKATFVDHGDQTLNGVSLRHITVTLGKNNLSDLLNATGTLNKMSAQQQQAMNKLLSNVKLQNASLDLWIDESTDYVHQMEIKFTMNINTASLVTPTTSSSSTPSNISTATDITIDYSKFNAPVTIKAPTNATPINNILSAIQ
ncbi:MAG: DUF6612 family protein [Ktedonobacteraceae bacterium]